MIPKPENAASKRKLQLIKANFKKFLKNPQISLMNIDFFLNPLGTKKFFGKHSTFICDTSLLKQERDISLT